MNGRCNFFGMHCSSSSSNIFDRWVMTYAAQQNHRLLHGSAIQIRDMRITAYPSTASVPITVLLYSGQWDTCSLRGDIVNTGVLSITLTITQNTYNMTTASLKVNTSPVRCCAVSICQWQVNETSGIRLRFPVSLIPNWLRKTNIRYIDGPIVPKVI